MEYFPVIRTNYRVADAVQHILARRLLDAKKSAGAVLSVPKGYLLAYEMSPVYTNGRRQRGHISASEINFLRNGGRADFVETLRGGHTTFHGPGQLVLYPVIDLRAVGLKVRDYVCSLEGAIIETLARYGLNARRGNGGPAETGVWLDDTRKIASIGIHVQRNVTTHGVSINVAMDPFWFSRIVACNLPDARLVSIAESVDGNGFSGSVSTVGDHLAEELAKRWSVPLIKRTPQDSTQLCSTHAGV